jgi:hypothetical protein
MTGPVQVLVLGFEQPSFTGDVMAELERLTEVGTVRVLDVLLVTRSEDGTFETLPAPAGAPAHLGELASRILGDADEDDAASTRAPEVPQWSLADAVPIGATAGIALIEHLWAVPLRDAIRRAGGTALEETWLGPQDLELLQLLMSEGNA